MYSQTIAVATGPDRQRLARRLLRDLVEFGGVTAGDLATAPRPPRRQVSRIFYRKPTDDALEAAVLEIGIDRWLAAADRVTQARCSVTGDLCLSGATIELFWPADRYALLLTVRAANDLSFSCNVMSGRIISDVMEDEDAVP
jgi:hypothetical protein